MPEQLSESSDPFRHVNSADCAIELDVMNEVDYCSQDMIDWVTNQLLRVLDELKLMEVSLSMVVVGDEKMSELHETYSKVAGTTDVLTFDLRDEVPEGGVVGGVGGVGMIDGEIVICADEARRRVAELNHPLKYELLLYLVHGVLHLLGYDDHDPEDHRVMHEEEDRLLRAIGVGTVFHAKSKTPMKDGE